MSFSQKQKEEINNIFDKKFQVINETIQVIGNERRQVNIVITFLGIFVAILAIFVVIIFKIVFFPNNEIEKSATKVKNEIRKLINSEVGISYHKSFILKSINDRKKTMLFFAQKGHSVKYYLEISHYGSSDEKYNLIVELNNETILKTSSEFRGGFRDITSKVLSEKAKFINRDENVHALEFSLDDSQSENIDDKIIVDCVIVVLGKISDE